jgi:DNA-binding NarL/FixJ family response regulator
MIEQKYHSVLVVDDHKMIVNGIRLLIGNHFKEFYAACDGAEALSLALRYQPELVIMDYSLPNTDGDVIVKTIRQKLKDVKVLVYSFNFNADAINKMFFAGVNGYVVKSENDEEFIDAIDAIMDGREYFCKEARSHIINRLQPGNNTKFLAANTEFTEKEIQIIRLICQQKNAKEISGEVYLSERTVEQYRSSIVRRIGEKSIIGILKFALKNGIVRLEDL